MTDEDRIAEKVAAKLQDEDLEPTAPEDAVELWFAQLDDPADSTVQSYHYRLDPFVDYLDTIGIEDMNDLTPRDIKRFEAHGDRVCRFLGCEVSQEFPEATSEFCIHHSLSIWHYWRHLADFGPINPAWRSGEEDAIALSDRQRERIEQIKEECKLADPDLPEPTDTQVLNSLLDTWDAVGDGHYCDHTPELATDGGTDRDADKVARAVVTISDPVTAPRPTPDELAAALEIDAETVRDRLEEYPWTHSVGDVWAYDRHVLFADSVDDVLDSYPERYERGDFRAE